MVSFLRSFHNPLSKLEISVLAAFLWNEKKGRIICNFLFVLLRAFLLMAFLAVIYRKNVSFRASVNATFFQVKFTATKKNCNTTLLQARPLKNLTFNYIILYKNLFFSRYNTVHYHCEIYMPLLCEKNTLRKFESSKKPEEIHNLWNEK